MQEVNERGSIVTLLALIATTACFGLGCRAFPQDQRGHSIAQDSLVQLYDQLLNEPSEDRLLKVLLFCSEQHVTEDDLLMLRNRLREPDQIAGTINGVEFTRHEFALACLREVIGSSLQTDGLPVKAILSRNIADVPYRYHLYAVRTDDSESLDKMVSLWINGFMAGRESALSP